MDGQRCAWSTAGLADGGGEEHERRNLVEGEAVFVSGRQLSLGRPTEKSPESAVRTEAPALKIVPAALWATVQEMNRAAAEKTWRGPDGGLNSRPTESRHLLTPFLSCGVCGGSMHVRRDKKRRTFLICTNLHRFGKKRCPNTRQLPVELAEKAMMQAFEGALVGKVVMDKLEAVLEAHRAAQDDPEPLKAEARALRMEIGRLVAALARGDIEEVHEAIRDRKAKLEHVEGRASVIGAAEGIDLKHVRASVEEALSDWRAYLRKNPSTAQQVLRKILPQRLRVTPSSAPGVLWEFEGMTDYRKVLEEVGLAAVRAALEEVTKLSKTPWGLWWWCGPTASSIGCRDAGRCRSSTATCSVPRRPARR